MDAETCNELLSPSYVQYNSTPHAHLAPQLLLTDHQ